MLSLSWWTARNKKEAMEVSSSISERRKKTLDVKLKELLKAKIIDKGDRHILKEWLLLAVARDDEDSPSPLYSPQAIELAEKWRITL